MRGWQQCCRTSAEPWLKPFSHCCRQGLDTALCLLIARLLAPVKRPQQPPHKLPRFPPPPGLGPTLICAGLGQGQSQVGNSTWAGQG